MPSAFPASVDTFSAKADHVTTIAAADVNNLQNAVVAIESTLHSAPSPNPLDYPSKAEAADYVSKTKAETISGLKSFSASPIVLGAGWTVDANGNLGVRSVTASAGNGPYTNTAPAGGGDFTAGLRVAGPAPWTDVTHPTYGAKGDGSTDDTAAFQAAVTGAIAANGALLIPPPGTNYVLSATVTIQPPGGGAICRMDILAFGASHVAGIVWAGAGSTAIFTGLGWKYSSIRGVKINVPTGLTAVQIWNLDVNATQTSLGQLSFYDCVATIASGTTSSVFFALAHLGGATGGTELSFINFFHCALSAGVSTDNNVGWQDEHPNGKIFCWYDCVASQVLHMYANNQSAGAASKGSGSKYFYGCGASANSAATASDFLFSTAGVYLISGGRWETGTQLVLGNWGSAAGVVTIDAVTISAYTGDGAGAVVRTNSGAGTLTLRNVSFEGATYAGTTITVAGSSKPSSLHLEGIRIQTTAEPFYSASNGPWNVFVKGCYQINSSGVPTAAALDRNSPAQSAPATLTGQTAAVASIASVTALNDAAKHTFRVGGAINITAHATESINLQVAYTDDSGAAQTITIPLTNSAGTVAIAAAAAGVFLAQPVTISVNPNTAVTVKTAGTFTGPPTYNVTATIEQLN